MPFGQKVTSIGELKKSLKKSSGSFIKYIPKEKDGTITVRFLTEPEAWLAYKEVYDQVRRQSWPVPEEGEPGYPSADDRVSNRYLANVLVVDSPDDRDKDKVIPIQLPKDLANQLVVRYEKYDTMCDRDYELGRSGTGLDTTYYLTPESPMKRKTDKYNLLDLEQVLEDAYLYVWGDDVGDDDDGAKAKPAKGKVTKGAAVQRRKAKVEEVEDEPVDLDALAELADGDDAEAGEALTALCDEHDIDPNEYETWAEVADLLRPLIDGDGDDGEGDGEAEDGDDGPDYADYGERADAEDEDAIEALQGWADEIGMDTNDYETWAEVATALAEAGEGDGPEPDTDDGADDGAEDGDGEGEPYTEEELKAKPIGELRSIARDNDIVTRGMSKDAIIQALLGEGD